MRRVSTDMMNTDMQYWLRRREDGMASLENRMARQEKLENLRDDPMSAAHAVRYDSFTMRLSRYEENVGYAIDRQNVAEGYMRQAQEIMQRVRELAVTGATGTFSKDDTAAMGTEVNELLSELVNLGNARGADGDFIFAGAKARTEPFRAVKGFAPGAGGETTTGVEYLGDIGSPLAEITESAYMPMNQPGNAVFWAEDQHILSDYDARDYQVKAETSIVVDGKRIGLRPGDTINAIIAKINDSGAPVKARLDPSRNSLVMETTLPHQVRLEDGEDGSTLADLGILSGSRVPSDFAPTARVSGGSLFDTVIALRDSLAKGDVMETGGRVLAGIDAAMGNMNLRLTESGARAERLQATAMRLNKEIPDVTALLAGEKDLDMTKAITDYRMMDYAHKASLQLSGKVLPQTLLDFLR